MFENKVASLRENIATNSEDRIKAIDHILKDWSAYSKQVDYAVNKIELVKKARDQVKSAAESEFMPLYRKLRDLYLQHEDIKKQKKSTVFHIKQLKDKIEKHEKSNAFIKLLTQWKYKRISVRFPRK